MTVKKLDVAIVGGGIAGLWTLNALRRQGYSAVLFEAQALGWDQTLASQGMIHGGLKYALNGRLNSASEAIAGMPERWRSCLAGQLSQPGDIDLTGVPLQSDRYYMFAASKGLGRLTSFFASKALRGRINKVAEPDWPKALHGLDGSVYCLNDFVVDTRVLIDHLAGAQHPFVYQQKLDASNVEMRDSGFAISTKDGDVQVTHLISCAGNGSVELLASLDIPLAVQQRPLKQVIVTPTHNHELYAHCLTGVTSNEPRLTITTDHTSEQTRWYLGGKIATGGVDRDDEAQIAFAQAEMQSCLGWLDWTDANYEVLYVDRAEPKTQSGTRPDEAYVEKHGDFVLCFPTKLALAPDLADQVLAQLPPPQFPQPDPLNLSTAIRGTSPWQAH